MRKYISLMAAIAALNVASASFAADTSGGVTFTKDIAPILQKNCQVCHRTATEGFAGMVAPMSLTTYEEVRPWAKSIAQVVKTGEMPPWSAARHHRGTFINERFLTDEEIEKVVSWTKSGSPRGNPADAPEAVIFPNKTWWLGEPDAVVELPEALWVSDDVEDWQPMRAIELSEEILPEDRWLRAIECLPDSDVVHHMVVYAYGPGMDRDRGSGNVGGNLGGLAPGAEPSGAPDGYGIFLPKGTTLMVSMHYHKEPGPGTGTYDQSKIGLHFYPKDYKARDLQISPIGRMDFEIPAGAPHHEVVTSRTFERPITLISMLPHMHFRGSASKYTAFYPDGTSETLLDVPDYDYAWQHSYRFKEPKEIPAGTRVEVKMWYDNSENNPANPDPTVNVRFGGPTTDEMAFGWMYYSFNDVEPLLASEVAQGS